MSGGGVYVVEGKLCVCEIMGMVFAHRTQGVEWYRDLFARIRDFFGGGVRSYDSMAQRHLIIPCLRELSDQAISVYGQPDAVIGVTFQVQNIGAKGMSMMSVTAQGTAVRWVAVEGMPIPVQVQQPLPVIPIDRVAA